MAILKCKMCGGDLNIEEGVTVCECDYCGTKQTVPTANDEKKLNLFNRATRLRINGEFDKAAALYESLVAEFPEEAEAYWGLVICHYGIEYVDDPATGKKIPTCHRASFDPISGNDNFRMAMECADVLAQKVYRDEAREIDRIREEILSVCKDEKPYDIFICYKETDAQGERTIDSVIAQDVYDALTDKGYRVFFARISLEDKLGSQYEPFIFSALNSARIMLAFGTKYEYFHAVWVKNEWSRFLKLMAKDKGKVLIPCYKDMDAYDMPDEFHALQAQDMGKIGAIQDLLRGVAKIIPSQDIVAPISTTMHITGNATALVNRGNLMLEDGAWNNADDFFEQALNQDAYCAEAYLGKFLAEVKASSLSQWAARISIKEMLPIREITIISDEEISAFADEMIRKYAQFNNISPKIIQSKCRFNKNKCSILSILPKSDVLTELECLYTQHAYLSKAIRFASGATKQSLDTVLKHIRAEWESQYHIQLQEDEKRRSDFLQQWHNHKQRVEEELDELSKVTNVDKREVLYQECCARMNDTLTMQQLMQLSKDFSRLGMYKDSLQRRMECDRRCAKMRTAHIANRK